MKILFLLEITNDNGEITAPNGRALEVLPQELQLRQTGRGETWLAFPGDDKGYNPESSSFVPLVRFPVALKRHQSRKHLVAMTRTKKRTLKRRGKSEAYRWRSLDDM